MKEFIDKLIARLEEYLQSEKNFKRIVDTGNEIPNPVVSRTIGRIEAYENVKSIVNKLAEEHNGKTIIDGQYCWQNCSATEHCKECNRLGNGTIDYFENYDCLAEEYKGGWIPCSERLPENNKVVLCWVKSTTIASGETYIIGSCDRGFWFLQTYEIGHHHFPVKDYEVVAWQQLPEEYQSQQEPWKDAMMNTFLNRK